MSPVASGMLDRRSYLRDSLLELLAPSGVSSTTTGSEVAFNASDIDVAKVIIRSASYTSYSAGSAEWTVDVQAATASGGSFVSIESIVLPATAKTIEVPISGAEITHRLGGRAAVLKCVLTKTGSPGNSTGTVYLSE